MGGMYPTTEHVKDAVKRWSTLNLHREFRVLKSSPSIYEVCCVKSDCAFRVYAYKGKWDDHLEVRTVEHHTCTLDQLDARHRNLSVGFVANHMYSHIVENIAYESKLIINSIEERFRYRISYQKAYLAKKKVLEHRWGTYEASYHNLPLLLNTIVEENPGSYYDIKTSAVILSIRSLHSGFQTLSTGPLHRWHFSYWKIQSHNPDSCGSRQ